jgi:hypothetical protein
LQPLQRVFPVLFQAAMLLGLSLQGPGSDEARMSKRRCTAEETLLTFWPPAPCARIALISTSLAEIVIVGEIFGMALILVLVQS